MNLAASAAVATSATPPTSVPRGAGPGDPFPPLQPLVERQGRFGVVGTGPVAAREIVPLTDGARTMMELSKGAVVDAVRGVLEVVQQAAGGAAASAGLKMRGIALSESGDGHGANTFEAHIDNDPILEDSLAQMGGRKRAREVRDFARRQMAESSDNLANVVSGWMNLGPATSAGLLATSGLVINDIGDVDEEMLARSVLVITHEAQHAADLAPTGFNRRAESGLIEALAEARTSIPAMRAARTALRLDDRVSDAALDQVGSHTPYPARIRALDDAVRMAGFTIPSPEVRELVQQPASEVAATLAGRLAHVEGISPDEAVDRLESHFADAADADAHGH